MKYGDFKNNGSTFCITERDIPRNWYNYMWNDDYVAFFSQTGIGGGLTQDYYGTRVSLAKSRKIYGAGDEEL